MTSLGVPIFSSRPRSSNMQRWQNSAIVFRLWETKRTVVPALITSFMRSTHFRWKTKVADAQNFVNDQHIGIHMGRNGKAEARIHPRRIPLHRRIEKLGQAREFDDFIELGIDLAARHAQDRAVQINILATRQVRVEASTDLDESREPAANFERSHWSDS